MQKNTLCITLPICAVIAVTGTLLGYTGDVDPPIGPVAPTMPTLEEIHAEVSSPKPTDFRSFYFEGGVNEVLNIEPGFNFVLTDYVCTDTGLCRLEIDDGKGKQPLIVLAKEVLSFKTGIVIQAGTTALLTTTGSKLTISGYVYQP